MSNRRTHTGSPARSAAKRRRIIYDDVTFSEHDGVRYLHFGTEWVQGAMLLRRPDEIVLEYAQQMMAWMLFLDEPEHIVQLGLGAAALTKFCYRHFPKARVSAVELNPSVIAAARTMFRLPRDDERLSVHELDAMTFVDDVANHRRCGALQVDLYDATARGPVLESPAFYAACRACLTKPGVLTVNLFGDHASYGRNLQSLNEAFDGRVIALPEVHQGNRVVLAFNGPPLVAAAADLYDRAGAIERATRMPARSWVDGVRLEAQDRFEHGMLRI